MNSQPSSNITDLNPQPAQRVDPLQPGAPGTRRKKASTVDLPLALAGWVKQVSSTRGWGIADLVIVAMEETATTWPAHVAADTVGGKLFPTRQVSRTSERVEPTRAVSLRLTDTETQIIADLVTQHGAASRTQIIIAALQAYRAQQERT